MFNNSLLVKLVLHLIEKPLRRSLKTAVDIRLCCLLCRTHNKFNYAAADRIYCTDQQSNYISGSPDNQLTILLIFSILLLYMIVNNIGG